MTKMNCRSSAASQNLPSRSPMPRLYADLFVRRYIAIVCSLSLKVHVLRLVLRGDRARVELTNGIATFSQKIAEESEVVKIEVPCSLESVFVMVHPGSTMPILVDPLSVGFEAPQGVESYTAEGVIPNMLAIGVELLRKQRFDAQLFWAEYKLCCLTLSQIVRYVRTDDFKVTGKPKNGRHQMIRYGNTLYVPPPKW